MWQASSAMCNGPLVSAWRHRWNASLIQFLRRRVALSDDVEDIAQETYMKLLRARDLSDVKNPQAYMLRVAGHVASQWRSRHPYAHPLTALEDELLVDDHPLGSLDAQLSQGHLDEMLAGAPPLTRAVLQLRFQSELSHREIAAALAVTERQVRRRMIKGYEYLRGCLREAAN